MAGVFFTLDFKKIEGSKEPEWKYNLLPSLNNSLQALSEGVKEQRTKYEAALQRMMDLRAQLSFHWGKANTPIDSADKFMEEILRPYMQLVADTRMYFSLPPEELPETAANQVSSSKAPVRFLFFSWKCAFASITLNSGNVNVELAALLFNMGVLYFNKGTGIMYSGSDPESCKSAFKEFQLSAGAFAAGKELSETLIPASQVSFDLLPNCFEFMSNVAISMAHRCAYLKASQEEATREKLDLLSKIATTGSRFLHKLIEDGEKIQEGRSVGGSFSSLMSNLKDNAALLEADGYLHIMNTEFKANECGAVVAKGRVAMGLLATQSSQAANSSNKEWLDAKIVEVRALHDNALSFNNSVYFQRIPDAIDPLEAMTKPLGKPQLPFSISDNNHWQDVDPSSGQPFKGLVGPEIIPLLATFREQISAEFGKLSKQVTEKRNGAQESLSRLDLDVLLCQSEEGEKPRLPDTLREKVQKLQLQAASYEPTGGERGLSPAQMLQSMLRHVANISAAVEPVLQEGEQTLDKEKERDAQFIHAYGEKLWRARIKPSEELPDVPQYRRKMAELRYKVNNDLKEALQSIVKTLNENAQPLLRVGMPIEDLDALIPVSETPTREQSAAAHIRQKLRELRQQFDVAGESEMQLMRSIPPLINAPETASALCVCKKNEREDYLSKKQVEFIDNFTGIHAVGAQREEIIEEMEKFVLQLAHISSEDPSFQEKSAIIKSVEKGIQIVEGAIMRISDLSVQAAQFMENANVLRQYCQQLATAREVEGKATSAILDEQLKEQLKRMQTTSSSAAGHTTTATTASSTATAQQHQHQQPPPTMSHQQLQQQQTFDLNAINFGQVAAGNTSSSTSSSSSSPPRNQQQHQGLAPPPPPPQTFGAPTYAPGSATYQVPGFADPSAQSGGKQQQTHNNNTYSKYSV